MTINKPENTQTQLKYSKINIVCSATRTPMHSLKLQTPCLDRVKTQLDLTSIFFVFILVMVETKAFYAHQHIG
jgi:hypothetical protein